MYFLAKVYRIWMEIYFMCKSIAWTFYIYIYMFSSTIFMLMIPNSVSPLLSYVLSTKTKFSNRWGLTYTCPSLSETNHFQNWAGPLPILQSYYPFHFSIYLFPRLYILVVLYSSSPLLYLPLVTKCCQFSS